MVGSPDLLEHVYGARPVREEPIDQAELPTVGTITVPHVPARPLNGRSPMDGELAWPGIIERDRRWSACHRAMEVPSPMTSDLPQLSARTVDPIASLDDPRAITLLTTEHWSLLSARSLAYNEAFVRAGMFLTFLSMSFVALALLAQAMSFGSDFLGVAALLLTFDLIVGVATLLRINGANLDDLRANHGMARIRHGYTQITPLVVPYFTSPTYDDVDTVTTVYGPISDTMLGQFAYGLSTSTGMVGLIVSMVGGSLAAVVAMLVGVASAAAVWVGVVGALVVLAAIFAYTMVAVTRERARFRPRFPAPSADAGAGTATPQ
jgi:phosphatidylglycerophosphate synthase